MYHLEGLQDGYRGKTVSFKEGKKTIKKLASNILFYNLLPTRKKVEEAKQRRNKNLFLNSFFKSPRLRIPYG